MLIVHFYDEKLMSQPPRKDLEHFSVTCSISVLRVPFLDKCFKKMQILVKRE